MKKLTAQDPETASADIVAENIEQLKALFPETVVEGKIDFDVLKQLLGGKVEEREEKYGLNWHGKRRARQLALTPSTGTLRPCPEDSVDWDTTKNVMIEGDNLEVLKLLQKSYAGKVKLIYIDPPYNTGKDFVYPDNFQDNIKNYLELTGQAAGGRKLTSNTEASGRFHTDWLNMMYPRLKLARNLLQEDGVIFISINDHEMNNLRSLLDEIFGQECFIATAIWEKADSPRNSAKRFSEDHDYIFIYSQSPEWVPSRLPRTEEANSIYSNPDDDPRGDWLPGDPYANKPYSRGKYTLVGPTGRKFSPPPGRYWRISEEKLRELDSQGRIWWGPNKDARPSIKRYLTEVSDLVPRTLWKKDEVGSNRTSKNEVRTIFPDVESFDTPKPIGLIQRMIQIGTSEEEGIILDFFAGSGTTGHAVLNSNDIKNERNRFILVQLPESIENDKFSNIAEITKERLRRAGQKIKSDNPSFQGDVGFRVFKLDSSSIRAWDPDRNNLQQSLFDAIDHIKPGRSETDLLYELLLKLGLDLCVPMEHRDIAGKTVHAIGGGVLLACLTEQIGRDEVEPLALGIIRWHHELAPVGDSTCVFRDSAFRDDVAKTNLDAILNQHSLTNVRSL